MLSGSPAGTEKLLRAFTVLVKRGGLKLAGIPALKISPHWKQVIEPPTQRKEEKQPLYGVLSQDTARAVGQANNYDAADSVSLSFENESFKAKQTSPKATQPASTRPTTVRRSSPPMKKGEERSIKEKIQPREAETTRSTAATVFVKEHSSFGNEFEERPIKAKASSKWRDRESSEEREPSFERPGSLKEEEEEEEARRVGEKNNYETEAAVSMSFENDSYDRADRTNGQSRPAASQVGSSPMQQPKPSSRSSRNVKETELEDEHSARNEAYENADFARNEAYASNGVEGSSFEASWEDARGEAYVEAGDAWMDGGADEEEMREEEMMEEEEIVQEIISRSVSQGRATPAHVALASEIMDRADLFTRSDTLTPQEISTFLAETPYTAFADWLTTPGLAVWFRFDREGRGEISRHIHHSRLTTNH